ncbi:MAG: DUF4143 domain-containing protein [Streptosporangiaceae bacterium]
MYPVHGYNRLGCSTATNPPAGQILNISKAGQAVGLESSTANRYATLLEEAFMIQRLPAWGTTLGNRIAAYPKVHVIDSGPAGWLKQVSWSQEAVTAAYFRTQDGDEADLVLGRLPAQPWGTRLSQGREDHDHAAVRAMVSSRQPDL